MIMECKICGKTIVVLTGGTNICSECKAIKYMERLDHSLLIQCPMCRCMENVGHDYGLLKILLKEGDHSVTCSDCGYEYEVETEIHYRFISPKIIKGTKKRVNDGKCT